LSPHNRLESLQAAQRLGACNNNEKANNRGYSWANVAARLVRLTLELMLPGRSRLRSHKKPDLGQAGDRAHFVSFNFPNNLIWTATSTLFSGAGNIFGSIFRLAAERRSL
jgi:hypothetical protein